MRTAPRFDEEIHAPMRLRLCALLAPVRSLEFAALREELAVADSVVSKHVARLEALGYVQVDKVTSGGRRRTWVALSPEGRTAFAGHIAALQEIAARAVAIPAPEPEDGTESPGDPGASASAQQVEPARQR